MDMLSCLHAHVGNLLCTSIVVKQTRMRLCNRHQLLNMSHMSHLHIEAAYNDGSEQQQGVFPVAHFGQFFLMSVGFVLCVAVCLHSVMTANLVFDQHQVSCTQTCSAHCAFAGVKLVVHMLCRT